METDERCWYCDETSPNVALYTREMVVADGFSCCNFIGFYHKSCVPGAVREVIDDANSWGRTVTALKFIPSNQYNPEQDPI